MDSNKSCFINNTLEDFKPINHLLKLRPLTCNEQVRYEHVYISHNL
jgi:hypothetical protein